MGVKFDFSGWATKNNVRCSDGRTICQDAFKENDGSVVPLVWNHQHNNPENVLGHAMLENRKEGVYAYCKFNDTEAGKTAKELVKSGDVKALSIFANKLRQKGGNVLHGAIREVSLVLAGANPEAFIDYILPAEFAHGEEFTDEDITEGIICPGWSEVSLSHSEENNEVPDKKEEKPMADEKTTTKEKTVKDVFDEFTEEQKTVVYALIGQALEDAKKENGGNEEMKHNVFDQDMDNNDQYLSHSEMEAIFSDAKRYGSLKDAVLQHGIEDIEYLFPEAKDLNSGAPEFIKRDDEWVSVVMNGVSKSPFSRIKSMFADITEDDARAKGYFGGENQINPETGKPYRDAKGNMVDKDGNFVYKKEEVFGLLKRTTGPTTIYKKQKIDRDDVIDITSFDVVAWLKTEMRMMLNEEIARAVLVGDGRPASSDDKINESCIRPIWKDDDFYTIKKKVEYASGADEDTVARAIIRAAVKARKEYKGSGSPIFFTTEDVLTDMLLIEDKNQRRIYKDASEVASAMRVSKIVTVPVMENLTRTDGDNKTRSLIGLIVNLKDYNMGADKGGSVNMFDDFDIDYNAQKYLIETRCSGAMIRPKGAIALEAIVAEG